MRIACEPGLRIGNADLGEQFEDAPARGLPGKSLVKQQDFGDLLLDGVQRIERRHRLLEDDGDVVAAHVADFVFRQSEQFLPLEAHRAGRVVRGRIRQQLHHRQCRDRLAGAALADQRHRLAFADVERHVIDRQHFARALPEGDGEIADGEKRLGHRNVFRGSKASRTASPMKISSESMMAIEKNPVNPSHGACTLALP